MNRSNVYMGDGTAIRTFADGTQERITYTQATYETRDAIATIRRYSDGSIVRSFRCECVDAFPARYAELDALAANLTGEFWPDRESLRQWQSA